jgi:hypothetical protein
LKIDVQLFKYNSRTVIRLFSYSAVGWAVVVPAFMAFEWLGI